MIKEHKFNANHLKEFLSVYADRSTKLTISNGKIIINKTLLTNLLKLNKLDYYKVFVSYSPSENGDPERCRFIDIEVTR